MGVMQCDRGNCYNIMCDRYADGYGYLCNSCFEELVLRGVHMNISAFMSSDIRHDEQEAAYAYFDTIFPQREY